MSRSRSDTADAPTHAGRRGVSPHADDNPIYGVDLAVGARAGHYVIEELRGRGGFATIYRARHLEIGRQVAIKVLHQLLAGSVGVVRRFQQEAQAVNLIRHPNIVDIHEFGELDDGRPYFVMEWLEGRDLDEEIRTRGSFTPEETLSIVEDLGAALGAAHDASIVHRDLKASNVLIVRSGGWSNVKLVDFGIAKLLEPPPGCEEGVSSTGARIGTPSTMAPEQILGVAVDARTDIYALGVLLYQMLTGELPFRGRSPVEVEEMHLHLTPPRPSERVPLSPALDAVVLHCLQKKPEERPANVRDVLAELRRAVQPNSAGRTHADRVMAAALNVCARLPVAAEVDDALVDQMAEVQSAAREACHAGEMTPAIEGGNVFLGIRVLDGSDDERASLRRSVIEVARTLAAKLRESTPALHVTLTVHVGEVVAQRDGGAPRFLDGELLSVGGWTLTLDGHTLVASRAALTGLEGEYGCDASSDERLLVVRERR